MNSRDLLIEFSSRARNAEKTAHDWETGRFTTCDPPVSAMTHAAIEVVLFTDLEEPVESPHLDKATTFVSPIDSDQEGACAAIIEICRVAEFVEDISVDIETHRL